MRERSSYPLLGALFFLLVIFPALAEHEERKEEGEPLLVYGTIAVVLAGGVWVLSGVRRHFITGLVLSGLAIVMIGIDVFGPDIGAVLAHSVLAINFGFLVYISLVKFARTKHVTFDTVSAAVWSRKRPERRSATRGGEHSPCPTRASATKR